MVSLLYRVVDMVVIWGMSMSANRVYEVRFPFIVVQLMVVIMSNQVFTHLLEPSVAKPSIEHVVILDFMTEEV